MNYNPRKQFKENDYTLFTKKHLIMMILISIIATFIIIYSSFDQADIEVRTKFLTDWFFISSMMFLLTAGSLRSIAWTFFKRGTRQDDDNLLERSKKAKYYAVAFALIGIYLFLLSIVVVVAFY